MSLDAFRREGGTLEKVVTIDAGEALRRQRCGHVLLDVRSTTEWQRGHIDNAMHAPLVRVLDDRISETATRGTSRRWHKTQRSGSVRRSERG
jgi:rhodanese-related sulfurtransferase